MIISHTRKIVILGNRKCGSSTIDSYFSKYQELPYSLFRSRKKARFFDATHFNEQELSRTLKMILNNTHPKHYNSYQIRSLFDFLNWDWDQYSKIVIIRNPWTRMLSDYMWYLKHLPEPKLEFTTNHQFEIFLMSYKKMYFDCLSYFSNVFDESYKENNFYIVKLEELDLEIPKIIRMFDSDTSINKLPRLNKTKHPSYRQCYTSQSENIVRYAFASDIKYGSYEF